MPSSVKVKYLAATSVVQQTFGGIFESDGWPMGQEDVKMVQCDTAQLPVELPHGSLSRGWAPH
ncbi:hypothetical protein B0H14DRAFT_2872830, partial [Mycena olivaceomarginata]